MRAGIAMGGGKMKRPVFAIVGSVVAGLTVAAAAVQGGAGAGASRPVAAGPKPYNGPWHRATETPIAMAKAVDARMGSAQQLLGAYKATILTRGLGTSLGDLKIKDSRTFHLEYPFMEHPKPGKAAPISKVLVNSNGQIARQYGMLAPEGAVSTDKLRLLTAKSVQDWVFGAPKFLVASIHRENALTSLIEMAGKPNSGFTLRSDSREVYAGGQTIPETRLVFERKPGPAKELGPAKIEILVNSRYAVPLRVDTEMEEPGRPRVDMTCLFSWQSSLTPFPASTFTVLK